VKASLIGWATLAAFLATGPAAAGCQLAQVARLPVVVDGNRPYVQGSINGQPMLALADTGAEVSVLWGGGAGRYGLKPRALDNVKFVGVGGEQAAYYVTVDELSLGNAPRRNVRLFVTRGRSALDRDAVAMIVGQDVLASSDIEFDLANHAIRLFKPNGCERQPLAYWARTPYSVVELRSSRREQTDAIEVDVQLNGKTIRAILDSGAYTSVISTRAARRAGVLLTDPGVVRDGTSRGVGPRTLDTWVGAFETFQIGGQTIRNARLRIADLFGSTRAPEIGSRIAKVAPGTPEMLLGADFLRSHRVLVSYSQGKIYFTHNGGKVFQTVGPLLARAAAAAE
jgi:predicted aspartyl protease